MEAQTPHTPECHHCKSEIEQKEFRPAELDINTQSLLLMFRIHELKIMECPQCGHRGMYL